MIFWNLGRGGKGRLEFIRKSIPFGDAYRPLQYTASGQTFHLPRLLFFCVVFSALLCCVLRLEMLSHSCASVCVSLCCIKVLSHSCARHCNHSAFQEENPQARSSRCAPAEPRHRCCIVFWRSDRRQKKDINIFSWRWGMIKIKSNSSTTEIKHHIISNPPKLLSCQEIKTKMHFLWARDGLQLEVGVLEGF